MRNNNSWWANKGWSAGWEGCRDMKVFEIALFCGWEKTLYWMHWSIFSQCKDLMMGEIWLKWRVLQTAWAAVLRISWRWSSLQRGRLRKRELQWSTLIKNQRLHLNLVYNLDVPEHKLIHHNANSTLITTFPSIFVNQVNPFEIILHHYYM